MLLAVLPPEYFPGLTTSALLARADAVVLLDTVRYTRQSLQNRAAIRTPGGRQWLTVPVGHGQHGRSIAETRIREVAHWRTKHVKALQFNYGGAPYFEHYIHRVKAMLEDPSPSLADVTTASTRLVGDLMGVRPLWHRASELEGAPSTVSTILEVVGPATPLVSSSFAGDLLPERLGTRTLTIEQPVYRQQFDGFAPRCSALDMLMLHGPSTRDLLLSASRIS